MSEEEQLSLGLGGTAKSTGPTPSPSRTPPTPQPVAERAILADVEEGVGAGLFSSLDFEFATRLSALFGETQPEVIWAAALACRQEAQGHVCANLLRLERDGLFAEDEGELRLVDALPRGLSQENWVSMLRGSALVGRVTESASSETPPTPLVLDEAHRLYLRRSWDDERFVAEWLRERAAREALSFDAERLAAAFEGFDGGSQAEDTAREALRTALSRSLTVVTGGPGTGKTTLVARLIALLIEEALAAGEPAPVVRLLAPTGKAAAAMTASFARQRASLGLSAEAEASLPTSAETIHRALMPRARVDALGRRQTFRLDGDVIIVDEASMVDLALMRGLFESVGTDARIVLLGDPDQLASVNAGAILAELDQAASQDSALGRSRVHLLHSHRFAAGGGIGLLAEAIRAGEADQVLALLDDEAHPEISLRRVDSVASVRAVLAESARSMQQEIIAADDPSAKLAQLSAHRVLCAHRRGALGAESLCEVLDAAAASVRETSSGSGWWKGRLLLVTRNAPEQDLWNGDVGLVEEVGEQLRALFPDARGGVRTISAGRLPSFESAIAMSVHKSQGSEFDRVDLVLGAVASGLMTRELLYTGVTRAREHLCIHASEEVIRAAVGRRVERDSGLLASLVGEN